jgi:Tfp pilus assembly protein PilF
MQVKFSCSLTALVGVFLFSLAASAQTSSLAGEVKGEDGKPLAGAVIKIDRTDIKGHYEVKTKKKGDYFHAGLPLGTYNITLEVDGKVRDQVKGVRTRLGDPLPINFDLQGQKQKSESIQAAAASGTLTKEQERSMSAAEKAAMEKALKEREQSLQKNKALNDSFVAGKTALDAARQAEIDLTKPGASQDTLKATIDQQYTAAVTSLTKAAELDPNQHVVWSNLAEAYMGQAKAKTGDEQTALMTKGLEAYNKAITLKPDDAGYHNNYALALARAKKFPEAQAELTKAAQMDPPNAGRYYYNLGALLVNNQQLEPAGDAFKKAIEADAGYADAYYQYGIYLISKAKTDAKGTVTPEPGTKEAFEKYLELKPTGVNAESAKGMLAMLNAQISTEYKNPSAPAAKQKGKKK